MNRKTNEETTIVQNFQIEKDTWKKKKTCSRFDAFNRDSKAGEQQEERDEEEKSWGMVRDACNLAVGPRHNG